MTQEAIDALNRLAETVGNQSQTSQYIFLAILVILAILGVIGIVALLVRNSGARQKTEGEVVKLKTQAEIDTETREDTKFNKVLDAMVALSPKLSNNTEIGIRVIEKMDETLTALVERTTSQKTLLEGHDAQAKKGIADILAAVATVYDAVNEVRQVLPTLATKAEIELAIGSINTAITRLEETKTSAVEKKHKTGELKPPPELVEKKPEDASALTPGEGKLIA